MTQLLQQFIRGLHNLRPEHYGNVVTIGSFDGVHLGHQTILRQLADKAREYQVPATVVIFEPQPHEFFSAEQAPARLMRLREKVLALLQGGAERVCCLHFNQHMRSLSAAEFVEQVLVEKLGVKHLIVGDDFRFGSGRSGDYEFLVEAGCQFGFGVSDTETFEIDGERVSSTRIRQELEQSHFAMAAQLLGKPYTVAGHVGYGQQLARQWQVPTANVQLRRYRSPLNGVFAVSVTLPDGRVQQGVANVGVRPTIGDQIRPILEVHLLDFSGNLYGQMITVEFLHKLREEQKFESLEMLRQQILQDVEAARHYFAGQAQAL